MANLEQIAQQWVNAFSNHDITRLMALYADQCVNAQPHLPTPLRGKHAIQEDLLAFMNAFPDGRMTATHVLVKDDLVAMEWNFSGTHQGPLVGPGGTAPATGKVVRIAGAEFTQHDAQGLIVDERGYFDLASFMMQLGLMPPPEPR
jgi:steroid delta-isomerase-like uncharacterized protein